MGIFNVFKKGKKSDLSEEELNALEKSLMDDESGIVGEVEHGGIVEPHEEEEIKEEPPVPVKRCSFVMGILDVSPIAGSDKIKVTGNLKGNAEANMVISTINFGDDNRQAEMTTVLGVEVNDVFGYGGNKIGIEAKLK